MDLELPYHDFQVATQHWNLIYKHLVQKDKISSRLLSFFMGNHSRLGANSIVRLLPCDLISHIVSFIREPPKLWILNLDWDASTYVAIKHKDLHRVSTYDRFLLGHNWELLVKSIYTEKKEFETKHHCLYLNFSG